MTAWVPHGDDIGPKGILKGRQWRLYIKKKDDLSWRIKSLCQARRQFVKIDVNSSRFTSIGPEGIYLVKSEVIWLRVTVFDQIGRHLERVTSFGQKGRHLVRVTSFDEQLYLITIFIPWRIVKRKSRLVRQINNNKKKNKKGMYCTVLYKKGMYCTV